MSDINLMHGDCLELMKEIPDHSVGLVVTDPPYLYDSGSSIGLNGVLAKNSFTKTKMASFGKENIFVLLNLLKEKMLDFNGYFFASRKQLVFYLEWADENKIVYDILFWNKGSFCILNTKQFANGTEFIVRLYKKGLKKIIENGKVKSEMYSKILNFGSVKKNKLHETQKPVALMERLILLSSNKNDNVLDPFMGSGSTGVACVNTGRDFIGIEKDEHYFGVAQKRIADAQKERDSMLFKEGA